MTYLTAPTPAQSNLIHEPEDSVLSTLFVGKSVVGNSNNTQNPAQMPQDELQSDLQIVAQPQRNDLQTTQDELQMPQDELQMPQDELQMPQDELQSDLQDTLAPEEPKQGTLYGGNYIKIEYDAPKRKAISREQHVPAIDKRKAIKIIVVIIILIVLFAAVYGIYSHRKRVKSMDAFDKLSGGIRNASDQPITAQERPSGISMDNDFLEHNMKHVDLKKINNAKNDIIQFIMNSKPLKSMPFTSMMEYAKKYDRNLVRIDGISAISRANNFVCGLDGSSVFVHRDSYRVEIWNPTSWGAAPEDRELHLGLVAILRPILNYSETKHVISKLMSNPTKLRELRECFSG